MEKKQLTNEELSKIQEMNNEFTKAKMALGDLEIQKGNILKGIELLKADFAQQELLLINKYGEDAVINVQTGEVTKKQA
jgi:lipopolysaccharide biosynthesis regulator YciM